MLYFWLVMRRHSRILGALSLRTGALGYRSLKRPRTGALRYRSLKTNRSLKLLMQIVQVVFSY